MPALEEPQDLLDWVLRGVIVSGLFLLVYAGIEYRAFQPLLNAAIGARWARIVASPSIAWGLMGSLLLVFRTFLWFCYRPFPSACHDSAPFLTVIIPAYNEGAMVKKTIDSVAGALYPRDRLEIFVVDDGSTDDTWNHIVTASAKYPGILATVRFDKNRGKRAALEAGFLRARGEVVVTIDSDSVIEEGTLLAMAGPFTDAKVGAVAGKVAVYNRQQGLIPRMLQVKYTLSFDFLRAVQSTYRTVYCCPGALTAYRLSAVKEVLEAWTNQTFLRVPCTYGEDRSMTNFILSLGYDTVYQRTATVHTIVPLTYAKLCRMYLRWDRSYVREEIRLARIVWKRPLVPRLVAMVDALITNLRYPVAYLTLGLLAVLAANDPMTILRVLCMIGLMAFFNALYYLRSERSWDFLYGVFYSYFSFLALFWVFPYAVFTVRSRSWMTR